MSETHFREDQNQESIDLDGFLSWRVERSGLDKRGGGLCLYTMLLYGHGCRISILIMLPMNFWRNSDLFKKKEQYSSLNIDQVRAISKSMNVYY